MAAVLPGAQSGEVMALWTADGSGMIVPGAKNKAVTGAIVANTRFGGRLYREELKM